ncbi:MAG: SH3 domain-containing protein [Roseicyclus sp.]|nr:SH3 domain-containing protein [Roseicyclus sp.]
MIRLTVTLIVAIYVVLIVVPDADHGDNATVSRTDGQNWLLAIISDAEAGAQRPPVERAAGSARQLRSSLTDGLIETEDGFTLETAAGEQLHIAAVIDPVDLLPDAGSAGPTIASISVAEPAAVDVAALAAAGTATTTDVRQIWRVAGNRVNFRAGPSTNTAVLTALTLGAEVEFLAEAPDNWAHLRVVGSGLEGYMAARFLEPVN